MDDYRVTYVIDDDGEPVAVFLDSGKDREPGYLTTYDRTDEHSVASIEWFRRMPPATEHQAYDLHAYLKRRYAEPMQGDPVSLVFTPAGLPR
ncbi:Uncharacterised protein (plasmid) [Tsukamurella tyrosinosolvens]|uniref:Uncharacterized protein n=1 Tax=Tsukamurella tyrosinosolvens TaxID=57704 RepID=A0A1H4UY06_TSUTY|nr:hypothetical protein [Tsukamurella tyrosinosolvens]KXO98419.1 hypothetical protein AXK58_25435 [Tsukamurella tyrosinosolvens]SEC73605.1 hypothetical protein SAMN04489793_3076 [Tsukamurella tyrosinosolvens]VEH90809.1 Uncharacterised protein [Tsukamurella tyrosinosolvens]